MQQVAQQKKLSPYINNYPLGIIFIVFGGYLTQFSNENIAISITGVLVIIHGLGTWVAGYFPMDKDPYTKSPTLSCKIHSWAGLVMLLSLLIAPVVIAFSPDSLLIAFWFRVVSIITFVMAIFYLVKMAKAVKTKALTGYYQRVSYWIKLLWLSALSITLMVN